MLIERPDYINRLKTFRDQSLVKVLVGMRRSGKSTLFRLFVDYLKSTGVKDEQIIMMNFDGPTYDFRSAKELFDYIVERKAEGKTYVFLDEVQMVPDFQRAINGLRARDDFDVYITGSNAYLLSGELATLLSGRYIEIQVLPLSFREYLRGLYPEIQDYEALRRKVNLQEVFADYMQYGGLPQTLDYYETQDDVKLPQSTEIGEYIENIFGTIVYKDIMLRHKVADRMLLEKVVRFVLDNIGQPISVKRIVDVLNGNQIKVSYGTIDNYMAALEECFLIYKAERYDIRGRELLATGYKYFVADTGLRNYVVGRSVRQDMGQLLENVVYLELRRRRERVRVGKYNNLEVDFVTDGRDEARGKTRRYYQVSVNVSEEKMFLREMMPFNGISDNYPKCLLTLDGDVSGELNGVEQKRIVDWLLGL